MVYRSAREAVEASERAKRQGVVYKYTSKVHRECMSSQRIRVAHLGKGKRALCKDCVAYHNFNAGRSSTSKRLSSYCMERARLELERAGQAQSPGQTDAAQGDALPEQNRVSLPPSPRTDADALDQKTEPTENQPNVCNYVIISQVQEKREARNRQRKSLEAAHSKRMSELKHACEVALAADARACSCGDDSRVHFLRQEAKFAYLFVNQLVPDAIEATETLRQHLGERTHDYCYDPREKRGDMASLRALDETAVRLRELKGQYDARAAFFSRKGPEPRSLTVDRAMRENLGAVNTPKI